MNKCSPTEMRKNLIIVDKFKSFGIDFVPMPVKSEDHKNELIHQSNEILTEMLEANGVEV